MIGSPSRVRYADAWRARDKIADNVDGEFFVRRFVHRSRPVPSTRARRVRAQHARRAVLRRASGRTDPLRALMALVTCPGSSIGTLHKPDTRAAARCHPRRSPRSPPTSMFCGWAAEPRRTARRRGSDPPRPMATCSIDSPRASTTLFDRLAELGGVPCATCGSRIATTSPITASYRARFGCERILHRDGQSVTTRAIVERVRRRRRADRARVHDLTIVPGC